MNRLVTFIYKKKYNKHYSNKTYYSFNKMSTCRICLSNHIKTCSIYETAQGLTYVQMLLVLINIKVINDSCEAICITCCDKIKEFYNFKLLIERSENKINKHLKIFKFNNINEIKEDLYFEEVPKKMYTNYKQFQNGENVLLYNNTYIKKVTCALNKPQESLNLLNDSIWSPDKESNESFYKQESGQNCQNEVLGNKVKKKDNICIRPVHLKDIKVMKTICTSKHANGIKRVLKKREYICPYCGKTKKNMKTHLLLHTEEKKFKCFKCSKCFYTKKMLKYHVINHSKDASFQCENCIAKFKTKASLKRHMITHSNKKDFECKICNKTFRRKNAVLRHMQTHNILRQFKCEICDMSFSTKEIYQNHSRVHTKERPYKCELCSQPYSYKRDFNRHCLKKHNVIIDRRSIHTMNDEVLLREKALMRNIMLKVQGLPTDKDPLDAFKGPQGAQAFATTLTILQRSPIQMNKLGSLGFKKTSNVDEFMVENQRTRMRQNYVLQRALNNDVNDKIGVTYMTEPLNPNTNPEELPALIVDYANMIRNDIILLDNSVETRTRKRGNIKVEKYDHGGIKDIPCSCELEGKEPKILGEDYFPPAIETRNCDERLCPSPYGCKERYHNITVLKRKRYIEETSQEVLPEDLKKRWIAIKKPVIVGCMCVRDF